MSRSRLRTILLRAWLNFSSSFSSCSTSWFCMIINYPLPIITPISHTYNNPSSIIYLITTIASLLLQNGQNTNHYSRALLLSRQNSSRRAPLLPRQGIPEGPQCEQAIKDICQTLPAQFPRPLRWHQCPLKVPTRPQQVHFWFPRRVDKNMGCHRTSLSHFGLRAHTVHQRSLL